LRPSSLAGGLDHAGTSSPSDEDRFGGSERPSSMLLLAENWKKLEKSGKLKSWNFGGKIKEGARRASLRLSMGRFSAGSPTPANQKASKLAAKTRNLFGSHSDIEDDDDSFVSTTTPLLHSSSMTNLTPPPKPPRTFKTKVLDIGSDEGECSLEDRETDELFPESGNEFAEVLAAIKKMGTIYSETEGEVQQTNNGERSQNGSDNTGVGGNEMKHEGIVANGRVTMGALVEGTLEDEGVVTPSTGPCISRDVQDLNDVDSCKKIPESESSRPVHRDETTGEVTGEPLVVSELDPAEQSSPTEADEKGLTQQTTSDTERRLEHKDVLTNEEQERPTRRGTESSVPFRRRKVAAPANQTLSPPWTCPIDGEGDRPFGELRTLFDPKRMSILSCASTEWFSAESTSSSGGSKPNSASVSPEVPDSVSSPSQVEGCISPLLRFASSDDECFSTPPCSPNPPNQNGKGNDTATTTPNEIPEEGQVTIPELTSQVEENEIDQKSDSMKEVSPNQLTNEMTEEGQVTILPCQEDKDNVDEKRDGKEEVSPNQLTNEMTEESQVTIFPGQLDGDNVDQKRDGKEEFSPNCDVSNSVTSETATNQVSDAPHGHGTLPDLPKKETSSPNRKRKRSLTVSSSIPLSHPSERSYSRWNQDDGYLTGPRRRHHTTDGAENRGMVSSFSEQDFADIFKSAMPVVKVESVKEDSPEEGEKETSNAGSAVGLNDADNSSAGEEVDMLGTPSSQESKSRTSTPDNTEPVVIPDTITPDMVSGHGDVTVIMKCLKQMQTLGC